MSTLSPTPDNSPPCSDPHVDGCPGCVANTEEPARREAVHHGCQCAYRCTDCGYSWNASWWCS